MLYIAFSFYIYISVTSHICYLFLLVSDSSELFDDIFDKLSSDAVKAAAFEMTSPEDVGRYVVQTVRPDAYAFPYLVLCGAHMTEAILNEVPRIWSHT